ncbi:MAG: sugar ABC transporter permease [Anaerolineae bacterium]|jgi:multiple sugar transport system permease protein|nr:sugar ABC transporter permease [Anaerolineae bacterium]
MTGKKTRLRYDKLFGLALISPWLIGFLLFKFLPILASLGISFTDFRLLTPDQTTFVGLDNYAQLLQDEAAGYVLFETIALGITTIPLQLVTSILLAALLNNAKLKYGNLTRTLFFLPSIIPGVAIFFMWIGFMNPSTGWLNKLILQPLGLAGFDNLYSQGAVAFLYSISSLWSIGPGMLIMLGALQGLSPEVQEAARVDGAGPMVRFFYITLPLITPAIFFSIVINLISIFGGVILLDRGNAFSGSFSPFDGYITYVLFENLDLGYAASLAWFFFILVMIVTIALFASARKWVYYPDREF